MTTDTPTVLIAFVPKPVVAQNLGVKVVCFVGRVVDVRLGALEKEETVMVYQLGATVEVEEGGNVFSTLVVNQLVTIVSSAPGSIGTLEKKDASTYITRDKVESGGVEFEGLCEIRHAHAKMTQLVHRRRT